MQLEKSDITNRSDLEKVLTAFYTSVFQDDSISHFFTTVVPLNMTHHLPVIADFWESVIFGSRTYSKNVMAVHQHINQLSSIKPEHLDRWVSIFTKTVDEFFIGPNAELMKQRAQSIATLMKIKLGSTLNNQL